ncbi:MFS transporter [Roseomonas sp. HJA6]|uniref:MFS transporter n=1 Tax=Roseomonas alba TaxID=2846776 RepID=A0ABS7AKG9_9PROT|nr:MFS transporter [Neoroseomonas alba]MBW6401629.1 MFS transporter [Neoroseomonas alba]
MTTTAEDGLPPERRGWAYAGVLATISVAVMDGMSVNVALPILARDFEVSAANMIWIVSAYQLILVVSLLPFAALGEIHGYRRVYLTGLGIFTIASLFSAAAPSLPLLVLARTLQGIGAAGIMSMNIALVRYIFPRRLLGRALGFTTMATAISSTIGPSAASLILSIASWHWIFLVNVPIGALALAIGYRSLPESDRSSRRFDALSALLTAVTIGLVVTTVSSIGHAAPWPLVAAQLGIAAAAAVWMVRRQSQEEAPLVPIDLLRRPIFALSVCTSVACFTVQMLAFVSLPFHLHDVLGFPAESTGLLMMPWPMAVAVAAPLAGRLTEHFTAGWLGFLGLATMSLGMLMLYLAPEHAGAADIAWRMALCGAGFGFFQTPNNRTLLGAAPRSRSGAAGGMSSTARLFGQSTGAALVALLLSRFAPDGTSLALATGASLAAIAALVSVARVGVGR